MTARCVVLAALAVLGTGCGDDPERPAAQTFPCVVGIDVGLGDPPPSDDELARRCAPPRAMPPIGRGPGAQVIAQSGCQACHQLGHHGNNGPGPDLTRVGDRLSRAAIRRVLVAPVAPMPSFRALGARKLDQVADTLAGLRTSP